MNRKYQGRYLEIRSGLDPFENLKFGNTGPIQTLGLKKGQLPNRIADQ
jgi:hypothetical protein